MQSIFETTGLVGVYYSVKLDRFEVYPGMAVESLAHAPPLAPTTHRAEEYRLVSEGLVAWMEAKILSAYRTTPGDSWGAAVLKFYRVRKCLETRGISENIDPQRRYGTIL